MNRLKDILREPALLIDAVETGLILLVAFGLPWSGDQQAYIVAAIVAVIGVAKGVTTRPFAVSLITDLGRAVLVLAASFGLNVSGDQIAIAITFLGTVTTLVGRAQITPVSDPVGAGPVVHDGEHARLDPPMPY